MALDWYVVTRLAALGGALAGVLAAGGSGCSDCSLSVSTSALPNGTVGVRYFAELDSDCGGDVWFIQTGELPPGIGLQENGDVQGIPTTAGIYTFTVGVLDFEGDAAAFKGLAIEVVAAPTPTPTPVPDS